MAITTFDQFIASAKQYVSLAKTASRTTVATGWFSTFDLAGSPGAGTLAGASTAAGVVPTDATAGTPSIDAFQVGGGVVGYLAQVDFGSTVACRLKLFDMVFKAGAYGFAAGTTTLSAQPSYSARMPTGAFDDTQIWIEVSTAFATGNNWQVQVTYTNQAGTTGRSTVILPATAAAGLTLGRMYRLALQAGDTGVQRIDSVIVTNGATAMTAGAVNVLVLRNLWSGRCRIANDGDVHDLAKTGMPVVYTDSALVLAVNADSTSSGVPELEMVIANG
jgi:hypothetical protein